MWQNCTNSGYLLGNQCLMSSERLQCRQVLDQHPPPSLLTAITPGRPEQTFGSFYQQSVFLPSVDHEFPRLSFVTRMIPSPDWFLGLDSLDLCRNRGFVSSLQVSRIIRDRWDVGLWRGWKSSQSSLQVSRIINDEDGNQVSDRSYRIAPL